MQEWCQKVGMGIAGGWVVLVVCYWLRIGLRVRMYQYILLHSSKNIHTAYDNIGSTMFSNTIPSMS